MSALDLIEKSALFANYSANLVFYQQKEIVYISFNGLFIIFESDKEARLLISSVIWRLTFSASISRY